jgi:phosphatidylethanolamine-binding protein (PEBP) family uncharacterized protein
VATLSAGTLEGINDWRRGAHGGPCPPIGRHRYLHKLYALETVLADLGEPSKAALATAVTTIRPMRLELWLQHCG